MKNFSDLNIQIDQFNGKKIEIDEVVGHTIEVLDFKIEPSKYQDKGNSKCLVLQIRYDNRDRVIFTGSVILQQQCQKVREMNGFPFRATIEAIKPRGYKFI
ncbi:hypothetical protein [Sphingobacterium siyangense]|uniref:Uncharacterized protein n=1 Tax=Sphingobacterium siyangense TaxID=459529 RepID=A0A562MQE3_9SPHI|nr:hypothetical protein [Sphingobacterium siyangense]TWI22177.1 hypothetical protein IQ31_01582 [Sphingobacterium siyangense]